MWHLCHDAEAAADLTQETFARAWGSLDTFAGESSLRTWLYTIALRCWCRWSQNNTRSASGPLDSYAEAVPDQAPGPAQKLELQATRQNVRDALSRLPSPFHEAVVLFYVQNLKYREVAEVLGVPLGTVKSRLHEGLKRLKVMMAEAEAAEAQILQGDTR